MQLLEEEEEEETEIVEKRKSARLGEIKQDKGKIFLMTYEENKI